MARISYFLPGADDDDADDLEDGAVVPAKRVVTIPLMLMDHGAPPPADPREVAYLAYKDRLSRAYLGDAARRDATPPRVAVGFTCSSCRYTLPSAPPDGRCPACGYSRPSALAATTGPAARISTGDVEQSQRRCHEAWLTMVDRMSNAWREGRSL
jgi:hypothetical protein